MTTPDFIIALFYAVDQEMRDVPKHPEAKLYPREVVTLALLYAIKGGGTQAFYRWLTRDYLPLFPQVPERTRLARLFKTHTGNRCLYPEGDGGQPERGTSGGWPPRLTPGIGQRNQWL